MFIVETTSPMDDRWKERDAEIKAAAGKISDFSGAGFGERDHGWYVKTMKKAQTLKNNLSKVEGVNATIREQ